MEIATSYLHKVFQPKIYASMIREAVKILKGFRTPYDAIAFSGVSGAAIAFPLSIQLKKPLICLRRHHDGSHYGAYGKIFEGCLEAKTYLFVDDCIASGVTARQSFDRIYREIRAYPVGIYLFDQIDIGPKPYLEFPWKNRKIPVLKSKKPWKKR